MSASESHDVEVVHDLLLSMRDGVRLAANLYRPTGNRPVPCLVNYVPYHKDGRIGLWYDKVHRFFAGRGYATLIVDFRGLGCSEGVNSIPFDAQEGRDGHDVVEWAATQPWCDGNVGMWGSSYGGITSLKTAAERPPHLKAIVPFNATWDNYSDFLLVGGCRDAFWANAEWGPRMVAYNFTPPLAPDLDGRLTRLWRERLEHIQPWCLDWYDTRDEAARWAAREIRTERITAATLAVCGWLDFYPQGTLDYFARLAGPKKLLMGPWKHILPDLSVVEPVGLLELMARWWGRWLRGQDNGADAGSALTLFVQNAGWRHEETWPPGQEKERKLYLQPGGGLADSRSVVGADTQVHYSQDPTVGLDSIGSDPWTSPVADPGDHNGDDARSLCFTTEPLTEDWTLAGYAGVELPVWASTAGLQYTAKLCDVGPDGRSRLVTMGWSPDTSSVDEAWRTVKLRLRPTMHCFQKGHRLRLGIALADFPRLWPVPRTGKISLSFTEDKLPRLLLPLTTPQSSLSRPELPPPFTDIRPSAELEVSQSWWVSRELVQQTAALESQSLGTYQLRDGGTVTYRHEYTTSVSAAAPAGAAIDCRSSVEVSRPTGVILVRTTSRFTRENVTVQVEAEQDGAITFRKQWERSR
jgi:putative CocE/NonD family hydrolase